MRTKEELQSPEFNDDMSELESELKTRNIPYIIKKHMGALEADGKVKELIGFYPSGEWHIIIDDHFSVIRGMVSFGFYEIMNIRDRWKGAPFWDPERFSTPSELVNAVEKAMQPYSWKQFWEDLKNMKLPWDQRR